MLSVRKILASAAIVVVAAVAGFALARTITTDGPDPHVDKPVVVRPAGDSDGKDSSGGSGKGEQQKQQQNNDKDGRGGVKGGGDRDDHDSLGDDRNGTDDHDDLTPVNPTPGTFDDDDDDADDDRGDDDGGGDDDRGGDDGDD